MDPSEKPRSDSILKTLPEERQVEIAEYAREHSNAETAEWLRSNGIETSAPTVSRFLTWYNLRQQQTRNQLVVQELLADQAEKNPDLTPERIYQLGQSFFYGLALARQDPRAWSLTQQIALSRERFQLATQKYNDAKQAADASKAPGGLTPETVKKIENELRLR